VEDRSDNNQKSGKPKQIDGRFLVIERVQNHGNKVIARQEQERHTKAEKQGSRERFQKRKKNNEASKLPQVVNPAKNASMIGLV
jgi:hypothetical protein